MDEELREKIINEVLEYPRSPKSAIGVADAILRLIASVRVREQREAFAAGARWAEGVVEESEGCTFIYATDITGEAARRYPDA